MQGGTVTWTLNADTGNFERGVNNAREQINNLGSESDKAGQQSNQSWGKMGALMGTVAGIAQSVVTRGIDAVTNSVGAAINRFDTLENAPRIFQNLGFSADESKSAFDKLQAGIDGLPTAMDAAVNSLTQVTAASGLGLDAATDLTVAFNNMALAGGQGPEAAQRAFQQFTGILSSGKVDINSFNTLLEVMPAQLDQIAKTMLGPTKTSTDLRNALQTGKISIKDFSNEMVTLNKTGGTNFASFSQQAKDATKGIGTSLANANTAIVKGVTEIIKALGGTDIATTVQEFGKAFRAGLIFVADVIKIAMPAIKAFGTTIVQVFSFIGQNIGVISQIAIVITALFLPALIKLGISAVTNIGLYIASTITAGVQTLIAGARMAAGWLLAMGPIGLLVAAVVAAVALIILNWDKIKPAVDTVIAAITPIFNTLLSVFQTIANFIIGVFIATWNLLVGAFNAVITALQPVMNIIKVLGVIILAIVLGPIALIVAAVIGVIFVFRQIFPVIVQVIGFFGKLIAFVIGFAARFYGAIFGAIARVIVAFLSIAARILGPIIGFFGALIGRFISGMANIINAVASGIGRIIGFFAGIGGRILSAIGNFGSILFNAGVDLIAGLINGVNQKAGEMLSIIGDLADKVGGFFSSVLGIHSPSTVFAGFGENIVQGLQEGIQNSTSLAQRAVQGLTSGITSSVDTSVNTTVSGGDLATASGPVVNHIGTINIASEVDGNRWIERLTRESDLADKGLSRTAQR